MLLLLAPLFGGGGRAQAGFVDSPSDTRSDTSWKALVSDFLVGTEVPSMGDSSNQQGIPPNDPMPNPSLFPPRPAEPATTSSTGSSGTANGGVPASPSVAFLEPEVDSSASNLVARLILAEQRYRELPFASRLFRPPRFMHRHAS